jgi:hypothetical protein
MHCKWEHKQQLPEVLDKAKIAARKSVRTKRIADQNGTLEAVPITNKGDKKRRVAENKLTTRTLALQNTIEVDGVYLKSGRQINIDDTRRKVDQAQKVIQRNISSFQLVPYYLYAYRLLPTASSLPALCCWCPGASPFASCVSLLAL